MQELAKQEPLTAAQVKANIKTIQEILEKVMLKDVHYGVVPGCGIKPALLKAGAEKIMSTFRLSADPRVEDLSTADCARYRVTLRLLAVDGTFCGAGVGEASTDEEKYKWKKAACKAEFDDTPEDRRRVKYGKDGSKTEQIRTNPADLANTVLKMAKKRAQVDAVLTATAASDLFEQDIDEMDPDLINHGTTPTGKPKVAMPQPRQPQPAQPQVTTPGSTSPEQTAQEFAQEVAEEMGGTVEQEYITVTQALTMKPGDTIGIKGFVKETYDKKVGAKGSDRASYLVAEGETKIFVSQWGLADKALKGKECFFTLVKVSEYQGKLQFMAEVVTPCN